LGLIAPSFRSDFFGIMLLYSLLSFVLALGIFYLWLLFLSLVNGRRIEQNPFEKLIRLHLGRIDRWPWPAKLLLPLIVGAAFWVGLDPLFARLKIMPPALSGWHRLEQGLTLALGGYLACKYLIA